MHFRTVGQDHRSGVTSGINKGRDLALLLKHKSLKILVKRVSLVYFFSGSLGSQECDLSGKAYVLSVRDLRFDPQCMRDLVDPEIASPTHH